jgi:orotidine-5'-phosphate decarboxylase
MTFLEKLKKQNEKGLFACAGLDPVKGKVPVGPLYPWFSDLIRASCNEAAAYKPNWAFFLETDGGISLLPSVCAAVRDYAPDAVLIFDMKCGDIGPTNKGYVDFAFGSCGADAITVHSYMGSEAMAPFLKDPNRGVFVLCRTSNPGAAQMQDVMTAEGIPYYQRVAKTVAAEWNTNGNCGLVVGATYPKELALVRDLVPELPLLIPGIGTQGGNLEETIKAAIKHPAHGPFIINQSSSFMYQPTLAESVVQLRMVNDAARYIIAG